MNRSTSISSEKGPKGPKGEHGAMNSDIDTWAKKGQKGRKASLLAVAALFRDRGESRIPLPHNAQMHNWDDEDVTVDGVAGDDRHTR